MSPYGRVRLGGTRELNIRNTQLKEGLQGPHQLMVMLVETAHNSLSSALHQHQGSSGFMAADSQAATPGLSSVVVGP